MRSRRRVFVLLILPLVSAVLIAAPVVADDDSPAKKKAAAKKAEKKADKEKPAKADKKKEPKGRLPNYFGEVVDEKQREKIYAMQKDYREELATITAKIKELHKEIRELKKKHDTEVEGVLTAAQLKQVEDLRQAAAEKRKKKG